MEPNINNWAELERLHGIFVSLTHHPLRWSTGLQMIWSAWVREGFTEKDLRLVVAYINRNMQPRGHFNPASLGFYKLITDPLRFSDVLMAAERDERARQRKKPETPRESILRKTGRTEAETPIKTAGQVVGMTHEEQVAFFAKCRKEHGV